MPEKDTKLWGWSADFGRTHGLEEYHLLKDQLRTEIDPEVLARFAVIKARRENPGPFKLDIDRAVNGLLHEIGAPLVDRAIQEMPDG